MDPSNQAKPFPGRLFFSIFAGVGLLLLSIAGYLAYRQYTFEARALVTTGIVIDHAPGADFSVSIVVRFETDRGETIVFEHDLSSNPPIAEIEERVEVRYDPADPENVTVVGWSEWFSVMVVGGIGAVFFFFSFLFLLIFRAFGIPIQGL